MGSRVLSTVGCFPELCFLQFSWRMCLGGCESIPPSPWGILQALGVYFSEVGKTLFFSLCSSTPMGKTLFFSFGPVLLVLLIIIIIINLVRFEFIYIRNVAI